MRRATGFLLIFLSVCLLFATCATAAGAAYLSQYAREAGDSALPEYRLCGQPAVLYAYDPADRADRSGEPHPALGGAICPEGRSVYVPYDDFPAYLVEAFVAIEDKRFFSHAGVDFLRVAEAGLNYVSGQGRSFGASTITQQLIKNVTGHDEYTLDRKFTEIFQALELEKQADKSEILEAYRPTTFQKPYPN
jgi:penicillin-binding protein 1A